MPTKKNFLGGQQNYNAKTGEYEPSLVGKNGQVVKDADGDGKVNEGKNKSDYDVFKSIYYSPSKYGRDNYVEGEQEEMWGKLQKEFDLPEYEPNRYSFAENPDTKEVSYYEKQDGKNVFYPLKRKAQEQDFNDPKEAKQGVERDFNDFKEDKTKTSKPSIDYNEIEKRKHETPEESYARMKEELRKQREEKFGAYKKEQDFNDPMEADRNKAKEKDWNIDDDVKSHSNFYNLDKIIEEEGFDADWERSNGPMTFNEVNNPNDLIDFIDKYMGGDVDDSVNNAFERLDELVDFSDAELDKMATGTGEEIMEILNSKRTKMPKQQNIKHDVLSSLKMRNDDDVFEELGNSKDWKKWGDGGFWNNSTGSNISRDKGRNHWVAGYGNAKTGTRSRAFSTLEEAKYYADTGKELRNEQKKMLMQNMKVEADPNDEFSFIVSHPNHSKANIVGASTEDEAKELFAKYILRKNK